jgi:chemotaxis response regulator CheB
MKHTDLIQAIRKIVLELPIVVVFKDVMGHQDKHVLFEDLDRPSQLNVQVDLEAKPYLQYLLQVDEDGDLEDAPDSIL